MKEPSNYFNRPLVLLDKSETTESQMSRQHPDDDDAIDIKGSVDIVENEFAEYDDEDDS